MDAKLLELSDLLQIIQDIQAKIQLQITDLKEDYFCFTEANENFYSRAKLNCSIANDYSSNISCAIEEARTTVEDLIAESAEKQKGGAA